MGMMLRMALYTVKWFTSPFPPPNPTNFFSSGPLLFHFLYPASCSLSLSLSLFSIAFPLQVLAGPCRSFFYFISFDSQTSTKPPHSLPKTPSNPHTPPIPVLVLFIFIFFFFSFHFVCFFVSKTKPLYSDIIEVSVDLTIICTCTGID